MELLLCISTIIKIWIRSIKKKKKDNLNNERSDCSEFSAIIRVRAQVGAMFSIKLTIPNHALV